MLIKTIEQKYKLVFIISIISFISAVAIVVVGLLLAFNYASQSRKNVYVLDNGIPVLVRQTDNDVNRLVEYQSHVDMFHRFFFSLPPDDEYMKANIQKAMYLIDESGATEYNNLLEKGYYNSILASSSVLSIKTDSVEVDLVNKTFTYFGKQRIERETRVLTRQLVTTGSFKDIPRSHHNPHGVLITEWKTILNRDIKNKIKRQF